MTKQSQEIILLHGHNLVNNTMEQISFNIIADGVLHLLLFISSEESLCYWERFVVSFTFCKQNGCDNDISHENVITVFIFKYSRM